MPRLSRYEFDREYVQRLIAEDPDTQKHFTSYFGSLLALKLGHRLRSRTLIDDARQETFVRVLAALRRDGGLASPEGLGAFVNSVCNNVLFELYRSSGRASQLDDDCEEPPDANPSAESRLLASEERQRVRVALEGLPDKDRALLTWLFFEEQDKNDICRRLKIDRGYLRVLVHRAKARFRDQLLKTVS